MHERQALLATNLSICPNGYEKPDANEVAVECSQVERGITIFIVGLPIYEVFKLIWIFLRALLLDMVQNYLLKVA